MATDFIITETAKQDVIEIVVWYDYKQLGLGDRFYKELLIEFERIKRTPTIFRFYKKDFRRVVIKHFPYLIIFKLTEKKIIIYAVVYGGRNPELINKKIN